MSLAVLTQEEATQMILDKQYITFSFGEDGFFTYLENKYFAPESGSNNEFEIIMGHMNSPRNGSGFCAFVRIKKTKLNMDYLFAGLEEFYGGGLSWEEYIEGLKRVREGLEEFWVKGVFHVR